MERLYRQYNRRELVSPDPLEVLYEYRAAADREVAAVVAATLAFGRVRSIVASVRRVLDKLGPRPATLLDDSGEREVRRMLRGFRHRFTDGRDMADLLMGVKAARAEHGSLGEALAGCVREGEHTVQQALERWVALLRRAGGGKRSFLLPDPAGGSACKRLHLLLRWMVRRDAVDPGGWTCISPTSLIVPLDVHMHRIARWLGFTRRKSANLAAAMEVTEAFRRLAPDDPVRYDFALTRLGMRNDGTLEAFLARWRAERP